MTDTSPGAHPGDDPGARDAAPGSAAGPAPGPPEGAPARPRLRRSRRYKVVGGVCGGLGQYFGMDPVIFRVVLGVLTATGGLGLVAYGFAWLLMPLDGEDDSEGRRLLSGRVEGSALTALLFAIVGCGLFLSVLNSTDTHFFAALLILCLGGAAYWSHHRRAAEELAADGVPVDDATAHAVADAPPETAPPPVPYSPSWWRDPLTKDGDFPPYLWGPDDGEDADDAAAGSPPGAGFRAQNAPPGDGRGEQEAAGIGGWTFLAAAGTCAVVISATWGAEPLGTTLAFGLGSALAVFGAGFTVSAWLGRTGGGTAFWALLTTVLLAVALWLPDTITADWGERNWRPAAAADVRDRYELGSGEAVLDLTRLDLGRGDRVETAAQVGLGQLSVRVPDDVRVELRSQVDIGDMQLPPTTRTEDPGDGGDIDVSPGQERTTVLEPVSGGSGGPKGTLVLDLTVSIGQLEVQRAAS